MGIENSTPVVVLRCARHGGLGITRTLGRLGVPVFNIDSERWVPAFKSRYCKGSFKWDVEQSPPQESVQFLQDVARKLGGRPVLIPTTDATATLVADYASELQEHFLFPERSAELVRSLASKREMYFLAKRLNIPTAETAFPESRADVIEYVKTASFPIMLKSILTQSGGPKLAKRMFIIQTQDELLNHYDELENGGTPNFMLQEYIPGGEDSVWMFNGYFDENSDCMLGFTGKKIRQYPTYTGLTSLGICLKNETVARTTKEFMKAVGYRGILDIGYRYDARDGQYKVLDINPRVGATFRLFVGENGIDVVRAMYLHLTGQTVKRESAREGRKWIVEDCDLISSFRYFRDGKLGIRDWIKSYSGIQEAGIFAMDDPVPVLWMGLRNVSAFVDGLRSHNGNLY